MFTEEPILIGENLGPGKLLWSVIICDGVNGACYVDFYELGVFMIGDDHDIDRFQRRFSPFGLDEGMSRD